jgi:predicted PurR-regulated permease PerM
MKLMRGYRFRREAFKMLKAFLAVFVIAFAVEALSDWAQGKTLDRPLTALTVSALVFMLAAAVLFVIDALIQSHEKKHGAHYPPRG